jgi:hypothetical protein
VGNRSRVRPFVRSRGCGHLWTGGHETARLSLGRMPEVVEDVVAKLSTLLVT